jgi:hypothetical protein
MRLTAPKVATFWVAVVLAILAVLGQLVPTLPLIGGAFAFWLLVIAFVILAAGAFFEGF